MDTKSTTDACITPFPATLRRNLPATRAFLRRIPRVYLDDRARSFFRFRHDHLPKETETRIQYCSVQTRLRRHFAAGFFNCSLRAAGHRSQIERLQDNHIGAVDDLARRLVHEVSASFLDPFVSAG